MQPKILSVFIVVIAFWVNVVGNKCLFQQFFSFVISNPVYQHYIGHQSPCSLDILVSTRWGLGWPLVFMTRAGNMCWWCDAVSFMPMFSLVDSSCGTNGVGKFGDSSSESQSVFLNNTESSDKSPVRTYKHKHLRWKHLINKSQLITSCLEHLVNITCNHCSCMRWPGCLVIHNWWLIHMTVGNYRQSDLVPALMQVHLRVNLLVLSSSNCAEQWHLHWFMKC